MQSSMVSLPLLPKVAFWVVLFGVKKSCMAELLCPTHSVVAPNEPRAGSVSVSHSYFQSPTAAQIERR